MHELLHIVEHTLGLCAEKHLSLLGFLLEYPAYSHIFRYIKFLLK